MQINLAPYLVKMLNYNIKNDYIHDFYLVK